MESIPSFQDSRVPGASASAVFNNNSQNKIGDDDSRISVAPVKINNNNNNREDDNRQSNSSSTSSRNNNNNNKELDFSFLTLYDRKEEKKKLLDAFRRQTGTIGFLHRKRELILLSGKSGTGKTALARTLRDPVTITNGGYFISGKFEQCDTKRRRPEPYAPLVSAFTEFVHLVIERGPDAIESLKDDISNEIDSEGRCLANMIPALELIIGKQETNLSCSAIVKGSSESHKQFKILFRRFVRAVCSPERPVVLFIDDLQWADPCSLELIRDVATDEEHNGGLMILVACRYDEVSTDHQFASMLRNLENEYKIPINVISVKELKETTVNKIISDVLHRSEKTTKSLAEIIYNQSCHGNVLFVIEILKSLQEDGMIYFDSTNTCKWCWKENTILAFDKFNGNVVNLIVRKMKRLPDDVQETLKVASCMGVEFDKQLLNKILNSSSEVGEALHLSVHKGFVIKDQNNGKYKFAHDRFHEAAYSLIPENERSAFHLSIGRKLWMELSDEEVNLHIFLVVNQLSHDIELLKNKEERYGVADLCLRAGEKSVVSSAFGTASSYYNLGIELLGSKKSHWGEQYDLSLALYNAASEAYYCTAIFEKMDILIEEVLANTRTFHDKIQAYHTKVYSLGAKMELHEAISIGLVVLECLGEKFPSKPRSVYVAADLLITKRMLRGKSNEELLKLPDMTDTDKIAAMKMMSLLATYCYLSRSELFTFICCRSVRLSLHYGLTSASAQAFNGFALVLCNVGDVACGYRCGQLSLSILDRFKSKHWLPRVYAVFYGITSITKQPMSSSLEPLLHAHKVGLRTGDIEFALVNAQFYCHTYLLAGQPLGFLDERATYYRGLMIEYRQDVWLPFQNLIIQTVHNFIGKSNDPLVLTGQFCNEEEALKQVEDTGSDVLLFCFHFMRLQLAYHFNEYRLALEMAEAIGQMEGVTATKPYALYYMCLASLAMARIDVKRKRYHIKQARRHYKKIKKRSRNSLENCLNKRLLVEAELETLVGTRYDAKRKYDESIKLAGEQGILHEQALACERAGMAMKHLGDECTAKPYFVRARSIYIEWEAHAKVEQIKVKHSFAFC